MSKKKTEINPIRAERVKILAKSEGITQLKLAEITGFTQQYINRIINMKNALTEETAQIIISHFPGYRLPWLLGYDDFMTEADFFNWYVKEKIGQRDTVVETCQALSEMCGIELIHYSSGIRMTKNGGYED